MNSSKKVCLPSLAFTCLLLNGCGANSSDDDTLPNASDLTAPSIIAVSPDDSADNVALASAVELEFDEHIARESATVDSIVITQVGSAEALSGTVSFPEDNRVLFQPSQPLHHLTSYSVTVNTQLQDLAGNPLNESYEWHFTTADADWGDEVLLDALASTVDAPEVAIDDLGNALVVWTQSENQNTEIWSRFYDATLSQWGEVKQFERLENGYVSGAASVAFDHQGRMWVVWVEMNNIDHQLFARYFDVATSQWSESFNIGPADLQAPIKMPNLSFDQSGNGFVVWAQQDSNGSTTSIWQNRLVAANAQWSGATLLEDEQGEAFDPVSAVDGQGNAMVVWLQESGGIKDVWASRYRAESQEWSDAQKIEDELGEVARVILPYPNIADVAMDHHGNAIAVWSQEKNGIDSIWSNRYDVASNQWGTATLLEQSDEVARIPVIDVDKNGNALVLWYQPKNGHTNDVTHFAYYDAVGNRWDDATVLDQTDSVVTHYGQQVAFDDSGNALAIWVSSHIGGESVRSKRFAGASGDWAQSETISSVTQDIGELDIDFDGRGKAWLVREQADNAESASPVSVYANPFE